MNKIFKIIGIIVVIAFLGYLGYWYSKASEIEKELTAHVEALKNENLKDFRFESEGVTKSGFPTEINVSIKNPKFLYRNTETPGGFNIDGMLSFGFDLGGYLKYQEMKGRSNLDLAADQTDAEDYHIVISGDAILKNEGQGPHFKEFFDNYFSPDNGKIEEFWSKFFTEGGELKIKDFSIRDASVNENIFAVKFGDIFYDREELQDDQQKISLSIDLKDLGVKFAPVDINEISYNTLGELINHKLNEQNSKSRLLFELELQLPNLIKVQEYINNPLSILGSAFHPININLKNIDVSGSFGEFGGFAFLNVKEDETRNFFDIDLEAEFNSNYTKEYHKALINVVDALKKDLHQFEPKNVDQHEIQNIFVNHAEEIKALIPKFYEWGTFTFSEDGQLVIHKSDARYKIDIKKLDLFTSQYGVRIHSNVEGHGALWSTVNGEININVRNLEATVHDLTNYLNRVLKFISIVKQTSNFSSISPSLQEKIIAYFRRISNDPKSKSKDIDVNVHFKDSRITVGRLSLPQFLAITESLYSELTSAIYGNKTE